MKKQLVTVASSIGIILILAISALAAANNNYTITGNGAKDIISVATAQEGLDWKDLGFSKTYENAWCGKFVSWCAEKAGVSDVVPTDITGAYSSIANIVQRGLGDAYVFSDSTSSYNYLVNNLNSTGKSHLFQVNRGTFTDIRQGDIVVFLRSDDYASPPFSHVGLVREDYNGSGYVKTVEGNTSSSTASGYVVAAKSRSISSTAYMKIIGFVRPHYKGTNKVSFYNNYSGKNYLLDSAFSSGTLDTTNWMSRDTSVANIYVDTANRCNGYNSLRIDNYSAGASSKDLKIRTTTQASQHKDGYVGDNKSMVLSFWAKGSQNGTKLYFRWGYESEYRYVVLTTEWQKYEIRMDKIPTFGNWIHPYADRAGSVWLSQMQLEDGTTSTPFVNETGGEYVKLEAQLGGNYSLPADPVREGYTFQGWYTAATGGEQITGSTAVKNGNFTAYAHWGLKAIGALVKISDEPYGETLETGTQGIRYYFSYELLEKESGKLISELYPINTVVTQEIYTPDGELLYWSESGLDKDYLSFVANDPGTYTCTFSVTGTVGGWRVSGSFTRTITVIGKTSAVYFDANGGSVSPTSKTVTCGSTYGALPVPYRDGYRFDGWYTDPNGGVQITESSTVSITSDQTLYAHWTQDVLGSGICGEGLTWVLTPDGVLTISGTGDMWGYADYTQVPWYRNCSSITSVIIENGVTSIGDTMFYYCTNLESVIIPDSVTRIGDAAFYECDRLKSVRIPDSVTHIGVCAFSGCDDLADVAIGNGLLIISESMFAYCGNLTDVFIPDNVIVLDTYAFFSCGSLTDVRLSNNLVSINDSAFHFCGALTSIALPDSLMSIGYSAFEHCDNLESITIPDSVVGIGDYAFNWCSSLLSINVGAGNSYYSSIDGVLFNKDKTTLVRYPAGISSETYVIPDGVTYIGKSAFNSGINLKKVILPASLTSIGVYAFEECVNLVSFYYAGSEEQWNEVSVDEWNGELLNAEITFSSDYLTRLDTAKLVAELADLTLDPNKTTTYTDCGNLTDEEKQILAAVADSELLRGYEGGSFNPDGAITRAEIAAILYRYATGDVNGRYAQDYTDRTCFSDVKNTTWYAGFVNYCASVGIILIGEDGTFSPNNKATFGDALRWMANAKRMVETGICGDNLTWTLSPDGVLTINGEGEMYGYNQVESPWDGVKDRIVRVIIGNSVTSIGKYAFRDAENLTDISIPDGMVSIGYSAFFNCANLSAVVIPDSVTNIGDGAFYGCISLKSVVMPSKVTTLGRGLFFRCSSLKSITIPDSVTSIGINTFYACTNLGSIVIPDSITDIGTGAFYACDNLTTVRYSGSQKQWNNIEIGDSNDPLLNAKIVYNWDPENALTGLHKDSNGVWRYYVDGAVATDFTGFVKHINGKYYFVNKGVVKKSTGLVKHVNGKYYYIQNGVKSDATGLVKHTNGKFYYVKSGLMQDGFTGLVKHTNGKFYYVKNGLMQDGFTGLVKHTNGKYYYVKNGLMQNSFTGLAKHTNKKFYYVEKGIWVKVTALVPHTNGKLYYVKDGIHDNTFNGTAKTLDGRSYRVVNGIAQP